MAKYLKESTDMNAIEKNKNRYNILFLRAGSPDADFRFPLAKEVSNLGNSVDYAYISRNPIIITSDGERKKLSFMEFLLWLFKRNIKLNKKIVFNSTNLAFPKLSGILRILLRGKWIFDLHDDLSYGEPGARRERALKLQRLLGGVDGLAHVLWGGFP